MRHFTQNNTCGYTDEQLARANKIIESLGYPTPKWDGSIEGDNNNYKRHCESALMAVENFDDQ